MPLSGMLRSSQYEVYVLYLGRGCRIFGEKNLFDGITNNNETINDLLIDTHNIQ
jgi:hypothetical protein